MCLQLYYYYSYDIQYYYIRALTTLTWGEPCSVGWGGAKLRDFLACLVQSAAPRSGEVVISGFFLAGECPLGVLLPTGISKWPELLFLATDTDCTWCWWAAVRSRRYPKKVAASSSAVFCDFFSFSKPAKHFRHTCPLGISCALESPIEAVAIRPFKAAVAIFDLARVRLYRVSSMRALQSSQDKDWAAIFCRAIAATYRTCSSCHGWLWFYSYLRIN